jgi:Dolichyl-phosphate-mannose-protein mannosyltransferase
VFALAFLARLAFTFLVDQPLLYGHQYHYFTNGLLLAQHPSPLRYVLLSDEWRLWNGEWTIAPLYYLFLGTVFWIFGPHLLPLRILQCALDALAAVAVASLGRRAAGPRGAWAGVVYALWWPAIEMTNWTMTENLHTVLFVSALALMAEEAALPSRRRAFASGVVLGFAALARSVSTGFLPIAALWRWWLAGRGRAGVTAAMPILLGGAVVILPWTARNVFLLHDAVLIESAAFENIWFANNFAEKERLARQREVIHGEPTPAGKRQAALLFAVRGIRRSPGLFVEKVELNFWHFVRPEGLHNLVAVQRSFEAWRNVVSLLLDDLLLVVLVPLTVVFVFAGPRTPARVLIVGWMAYYLLMIVVVFHNEIRYRSAFVPFACVAAAGGLATLADPARRRRIATWGSLAVGLIIVAGMLRPYAVEAWRDASSTRLMATASRAVEGGASAEAWRIAEQAAARAPRSPRPWFDLGKALDFHGDTAGALAAYAKGDPRAVFPNWRGLLARARLLPLLEGGDAAARAVRQADRASWDVDPWLVLEIAWRELPPPHADEVLIARNDYGAVRGMFHPRGVDAEDDRSSQWARYEEGGAPPPGSHRWTRGRAWVRLLPTVPASACDVTVEMGSPFPSPLTAPVVTVRGNDGVTHAQTLTASLQPYTFRIGGVRPGEPLLLRFDSPVWSRAGEPADQGIRIDRVSVHPAP